MKPIDLTKIIKNTLLAGLPYLQTTKKLLVKVSFSSLDKSYN